MTSTFDNAMPLTAKHLRWLAQNKHLERGSTTEENLAVTQGYVFFFSKIYNENISRS
jgi:hypothetical protein